MRSPKSRCAPASSTAATWCATSATSSAIVKGWIDRELDHKMLLRHDDPLVEPLQQLGEPIFICRQQSHRRAHRAADLRLRQRAGTSCRAREGVGDADVVRGVHASDPACSSSISTARSSIPFATSPIPPTSCSCQCGAAPLARGRRSAAWSATGAATLVARAFAAAGIAPPPDALAAFLAIYDARLLDPHAAVRRDAGSSRDAGPRALARGPDEQTARRDAANSRRPGSRDVLRRRRGDRRRRSVAAQAGSRRAAASVRARAVAPADAMLVGDSHVDWRTARDAGTAICLARYGFGFLGFSVRTRSTGANNSSIRRPNSSRLDTLTAIRYDSPDALAQRPRMPCLRWRSGC